MHPAALCLPPALRSSVESFLPSPIAPYASVSAVTKVPKEAIFGDRVGISQLPPEEDLLESLQRSQRPIHVPTMPLG